jgi:hypothetical protein
MAGSSKAISKVIGNSKLSNKHQVDIPNGRVILDAIGLTRERLNAGPGIKVPVPASLLKELLVMAASSQPFDEDFYLDTYPDIRKAMDEGQISSARTHFVEQGFLEGRFGSKPDVDEGHYKLTYPDVAAAINAGSVSSALEHYIRAGAFESRNPTKERTKSIARWMTIIGK